MAQFHSLRIKEVRPETQDCVSIAFDVPTDLKDVFQYIQGQYLTLRQDIKGEDVRRSYSICSGPLEVDELRVAVKKVPGGLFSTYANEHLQTGDALEVMPPMGRFFTELNPENQKHYVAFAAGSGITPIMSILKTVMEIEPNSRFTLFYGNSKTATIIFREELSDLKNRYLGRMVLYHLLSREEQLSDLFNGRLSGEKCERFCDILFDPEDVDEFFLCGPAEMITDVSDTLIERGVDKKKVHFELFTSPGQGKQKTQTQQVVGDAGKQIESSVKVILDGDEIEFPLASNGENILDAALNMGMDVPYACKGAVCCTCRAKVTEGEVNMVMNYALEPEEVEAGFVLTCQCHPVSEKVVIDFDQQ
ncbi:MAG: 1,2-phenylacetyl-CoA epoxidase subunit PaaE [Salibacteraceae bacterium]